MISAPDPKKKKIFVALSGGIDSAVAAALLKEKGYKVVGCFMRLHDYNVKNRESSEKSAREIAAFLGIDFKIFDFRKEFQKEIIYPFLRDYENGLTPNPCVFCNEKIKFDLFWQHAREEGADLMATGHYARIKRDRHGLNLYRARDKNKDQSYFLWRLKKEQLDKIIFPLGGYSKEEVRKMGKRWGLKAVERKESMEICFVPGKIEKFLHNNLILSPGPILDLSGKIIGRHKGLFLYTIGQRKRIGLSGGPYYVCNKNMSNNAVIVTKDKEELKRKILFCHQLNWLDMRTFRCPVKVKAQIRYSHKPARGIMSSEGKGVYKVIFNLRQSSITPGQSVVFYRRLKLLGGGVIMPSRDVSI